MPQETPQPTPGGGLCIAWQLRGKPVLLIGGGEVAASRIVHLKSADAHITLLAPRDGLHPDVETWIKTGVIQRYIPALYKDTSQLVQDDGSDYTMVLTAIDDAQLSHGVCQWCRERRIPVNVADVPPECDFYFGSMIRRGPLQVMVSTGGRGPRLARKMRQCIEAALPERAGDAIMQVGMLRSKLRHVSPDPQDSAARMSWMTKVCEAKTLDELAMLDEATAERWVHEDWPNRRIPSSSLTSLSWPSSMASILASYLSRVIIVPCSRDVLSFTLGAASTGLAVLAWSIRK